MRFFLIILFFNCFSIESFGQDIENKLKTLTFYSDINPIGNTAKDIILKTSRDSTFEYEIKFLSNHKFYFSWVNRDNMFDSSGDLIPPGTKNENQVYDYQIKNHKIHLFTKIISAKTGVISTKNYYYEATLTLDNLYIKLTPITKVQYK